MLQQLRLDLANVLGVPTPQILIDTVLDAQTSQLDDYTISGANLPILALPGARILRPRAPNSVKRNVRTLQTASSVSITVEINFQLNATVADPIATLQQQSNAASTVLSA
jgi:hypothetical protein